MASSSFEVYIERMFARKLISKTTLNGSWYLDHKCGRAFSTALQVACWRGSVRAVGTLLNEGADPNSTNVVGVSCLGAAAVRNRINIISLLLAHGAKLNNTDQQEYGLNFGDLERAAMRYLTSQS
jgi:ankyrin repeat protein